MMVFVVRLIFLVRRDLALNWNVDIANDLEQYLNELELIEISFDGGATTLNFAEAALLIQGSTCVYSRKVEYLYQLVFKVLDIIADRQRKSDGADGNANSEDPDSAFPEEPEFISLDDIVPAKRSAIDMVEKPNASGVDNTVIPRSPTLLMQINLEGDSENTDPNKDFKLASAAVHSSGALLLEPRMQYMLDGNLKVTN
jgi:condensin-2 complex subunit H2